MKPQIKNIIQDIVKHQGKEKYFCLRPDEAIWGHTGLNFDHC